MGLLNYFQKLKLKRQYWFSEKEIELFTGNDKKKIKNLHNTHLSSRAYKGLRPKLDEFNWHSIVHNKWISINYFRSQGIETPETYGLFHPVFGLSTGGQPLKTAQDIFSLAKDKGTENFVIKHIGGGTGSNVYVIKKIEHVHNELQFVTISGRVLSGQFFNNLVQEFHGGIQGYIVEEKLKSHPEMDVITQGGLSSIRINTLIMDNGKCKNQVAFLRIGMRDKATDHSSNGGIMVPIELDNGILQKGLILDGPQPKWISHHPETHLKFEGLKIPHWEKVLNLAEKAALHSPGLKWVGWDIVITPTQPVVLEGNVGVNLPIYQQLFGGFIKNGLLEEWNKYVLAEKPNGSLSWRFRHWDKGRRLSPMEHLISGILKNEKR